ncbi:MAG: family 78 glycoside hydrolase catalytic domain [Janthinobacterium lividum]
MYRFKLSIILILFLAPVFLFNVSIHAQSISRAVQLKTEYLVNPLGIDTPLPRFTWQLIDNRQGARQTAYRILVDTDSATVNSGKGKIWDTQTVQSDANLMVYNGQPFQPFTKYYWKVILTNQENKQVNDIGIASFETGMMQASNWKGSWISDVSDINLKPAPYFRKNFSMIKKVKSARAYIAVAGLYELYINGKKIGNHRLDPMYIRFDRRTLYVTYDVTSALQNGQNAVGVLLGNGWYNFQSTAVWDFHKANWRARPTFCLDMRITYEDDSVETITSGKGWKTALSPTIFNSLYTAEHYDARLEQAGWNTISFDDAKWKEVMYRSAPSDNIVAQVMYPIRNVEEIKTKSVRKFNDTSYVFDLGRNFSGVSKIKVKGSPGTIIRLRHAERLYPNGHTDISNIDIHYRPTDNTDPFQTDIFILSGKGEETFMPHFNYKGF